MDEMRQSGWESLLPTDLVGAPASGRWQTVMGMFCDERPIELDTVTKIFGMCRSSADAMSIDLWHGPQGRPGQKCYVESIV